MRDLVEGRTATAIIVKDPEDKERRRVDEEAARVVREIFNPCIADP